MRLPKLTRRKTITALIVLIISALAQFIVPNPVKQIKPKPSLLLFAPNFSKVTRVIDGDTIEIENGQKVRYIGIDTPELHHPKKEVQCFAQEAYLKNKELVEGKIIKLEKDISETDKYGRLLRYVYLQENNSSSAAIFVNNYLAENGYAYAATFPPDVRFADLFKESQTQASIKGSGLWKSCPIIR